MFFGVLGVPVFALAGPYSPAPFYHNLIENPNADTGDMRGWTLTTSGGNGWVVNRGADVTKDHDNGFSTSYEWARREQTIDLIAQGFSPQYLDAQPPLIASEIFEKVFCADYFYLNVELLDANQNVLRTWSSGERRHQDTRCDYSGYREQLSMELNHYGPGVRFIRWRDGGKDSERWAGHFGTKLQNAYLGFAPANLLNAPGELSSWTILENGGNGFKVSGPPEARRFSTSYGWARRQQTIDLMAAGYTAAELDAGNLPIFASASYGKMACSDRYYLKVQLLDANRKVLDTFDSGERTHEGECDWTYSPYREIITHRFNSYPAGTRYIRWEDGGRDSERWQGHFGAYLEAPYLGITNHAPVHRGSPRMLRELALEDYWPTFTTVAVSYFMAGLACVGSVGLACGPALAGATIMTASAVNLNTGILLSLPSPRHTDNPPVACDVNCKLARMEQSLDANAKGKIWSLDNNDSIAVLAGPRKDKSLSYPAQEVLGSVKQAVAGGTQYIDITTLADITGTDWKDALADALKTVDDNARANNKAPVVRIYLGLGGVYSGTTNWYTDALYRYFGSMGFPDVGIAEQNWDNHLKRVLGDVTRRLQVSSGDNKVRIYISGGRSPIDRNWNHSKIVAVDGRRAIVGGHNMWEEYFGDQPVFDTSLNLVGSSARAAHRFADELWNDQQKEFTADRNCANGSKCGKHIFLWENKKIAPAPEGPPNSNSIAPAAPGTGSLRVLSVGQLGQSKYASQVKKAVLSMLDTAEQSIYISQQSLVHPYVGYPFFSYLLDTVDKTLMTKLAQKAIAGVDVRLVLSNENAPHQTGSNLSNEKMLKVIWKVVTSNGVANKIDTRKAFCQHFHLGNLRVGDADVYPGARPQPFANHSKTLMVDKQVFLVGSHNLYEQAPMQLSEFAFVVADESKAQEYYRQYWDPVLSDSERTLFDEGECQSIILDKYIDL